MHPSCGLHAFREILNAEVCGRRVRHWAKGRHLLEYITSAERRLLQRGVGGVSSPASNKAEILWLSVDWLLCCDFSTLTFSQDFRPESGCLGLRCMRGLQGEGPGQKIAEDEFST